MGLLVRPSGHGQLLKVGRMPTDLRSIRHDGVALDRINQVMLGEAQHVNMAYLSLLQFP